MSFNLKHRHFLTSQGNIRLRYIIIAGLILCFVGWGISAITDRLSNPTQHNYITAQDSEEFLRVSEQDDMSDMHPDHETVVQWGDYDPEEAGQGVTPFLSRMGVRPYFNKPYRYVSEIEVKSGDVLSTLMEQINVHGDDYRGALTALQKHVDSSDIQPGQKIQATYEKHKDKTKIIEISYVFDSLTAVRLSKDSGKWTAEKTEQELYLKNHAAKAKIENSIYGSMAKAGIPDGIINRMIKAYSWTVDFQRDIWGGEEVEVLYETKENEDGSYVRSHQLLYANLKLRGRKMPVYLFEKEKGFPNYFEPDGQSIKRALMKTPINGARLSSGYGMRKHPVLGYSKMHKGVDFAAPTGTPIYAAGDGVVKRANRFSSYGNYIKIRHNETYSTAYAHLHGFAKGIRAGTRVKQGQVIAYVGTTGRSTGPHLHYEVIKNGKQVNPHSVDLPLGEQLRGKKMVEFANVMKQRNARYQDITGVAPALRTNTTVLPEPKPDL